MSPEKRLKSFIIDPGAVTELALANLDLCIFAFFVLAAGAACGCFLCVVSVLYGEVIGIS